MEASSRATAGPSLPAASQRLLEEFHRTGSFALKTSGRAIAGIAACTVPFLGMFGFSFASPAPMMPVVRPATP